MFLSVAMLVVRYLLGEERSQCLPYNAEHQARSPLVPFLTPLVWRGGDSNPRPPDPEADALPLSHRDVCHQQIYRKFATDRCLSPANFR